MSIGLADGFSPDNIERIYRGQPAQVDGLPPADLLEEQQLQAVAMLAEGYTHKEVTDILDSIPATHVLDHLQSGRNTLGIRYTFQLAGYFPLESDHDVVTGKKLADLKDVPGALDIVEALSVGKLHKQVAAAAKMSGPKVIERMRDIERVWEDELMAVRIANAIRARYVKAIEAKGGAIEPVQIPLFTLPNLVKLEPHIQAELIRPKTETVADLTHADA